jgi:hypothetical protein
MASIIVDQFEGRAMWPMTDAEAVLFRRAVGGAGAGGREIAVTPHRWFARGLKNGDDGLEQHKGPVWLDKARAFDSAHRSSA